MGLMLRQPHTEQPLPTTDSFHMREDKHVYHLSCTRDELSDIGKWNKMVTDMSIRQS